MRSQSNRKGAERLATASVCLALSLILSYIEYLVIPPLFPGVKLGMANVLIMFLFFRYGIADAMCVSLLRAFLSSLIFGNFSSLAFSVSGAVLSLSALVICVFLGDRVSRIGASVFSAAMHGTGQILAAAVIYSSVGVIYYLPMMLLVSIPLGAVSGCMLILIEARIKPAEKTE